MNITTYISLEFLQVCFAKINRGLKIFKIPFIEVSGHTVAMHLIVHTSMPPMPFALAWHDDK